MILSFAIWAPDEQTFWQSWVSAGICTEPYIWTPEYSDLIQLTDWHGGKIPLLDEQGEVTGVKPGWFANCRISGRLAQELTTGLDQYDEDGNLKDVFARSRLVDVLGLTAQPADSETGFPAGWRNSAGVAYTDMRNVRTPYNVWA